MKSNYAPMYLLPLALIGLASTSGCIINPDGTMRVEPVVFAPAPVVVAEPPVAEVPETYVWDGTEFVGTVGDQYYYLAPSGVWLVADPVRLRYFHNWEHGHSDWRSHAVRNDRFRRDARGHVQPRHEVAHGKPQKADPKKKTEQH